MEILFHSKFLQHNLGSFAEGPYRIEAFPSRIKDTDSAGERYITLVHSQEHLQRVRAACMNHQVMAEVALSPESYEAACTAVGLTVQAAEQNAFAVVRPPGHHAKVSRADGFCLFNNLAVQKLVSEGRKVFILDIDGHHGDGTQQIFYRSDRVLYCSIHQQYAYPGTGHVHETGEGPGRDYTLNFPLPAGSGDRELLYSMDTAMERAEEFKPEVVGVSAGFDGYKEDRLLDLNYSLDGYYQVGNRLGRRFDRIFAVLEGGYHADIPQCVDQFIRGTEAS